MTQNVKFPPSVEIKRAIAAAERTGIRIGSIEIQPRKIIIVVKDSHDESLKEQTYAGWKAAQHIIR